MSVYLQGWRYNQPCSYLPSLDLRLHFLRLTRNPWLLVGRAAADEIDVIIICVACNLLPKVKDKGEREGGREAKVSFAINQERREGLAWRTRRETMNIPQSLSPLLPLPPHSFPLSSKLRMFSDYSTTCKFPNNQS